MIMERTEKFAKEVDDVMFLLVDFVGKIKSGIPLSQAAIEELQNALNAIAGVVDIPAEFNADFQIALRTVLARSGELVGVLLKKSEVVPVAQVEAPEQLPSA